MTRTERSRFLDRLLTWSMDNPLPPLARYMAAALLIVIVGIGRALFVTGLLPWLLFIPAVIIVGLAFAEGPALFASVLATILAALSIGSSTQPLWLTEPQWAGSILFFMVAVGLAMLSAELRASLQRTRLLNIELAEREAFLSGVLASSTDCIKVLDLEGRLTFMSEGGMKAMEVSDFNAVKDCPWPDFWTSGGNTDANDALEAARQGRASHFVGQADTFMGTSRWWNVSVSPIAGPDGVTARILSVSRDTTALMAAQEQQRLLNGELSHRLKNVLALIQSIAHQTFRQADSLDAANTDFTARLTALGKATDILTATSWQSAMLADVAHAGLTSVDGMIDRITIDGPPVELAPQLALALTLALHELATNACKYGALSNDTGTVALRWRCEAGRDGGEGRFICSWHEAGGPAVSKPTRRGFGSRMIERSLQSYFSGETSLDFNPAGIIFTIDAPMPQAGAVIGE